MAAKRALPVGVGKRGSWNSAARDVELLLRLVDVAELLVAGDDLGDHLADVAVPLQLAASRRAAVAEHAVGDARR